VAFFWNQFAILHTEPDHDFLDQPDLQKLRSSMADSMDAMAQSVERKTGFPSIHPEALIDPSLLTHPRYGEYVNHSIARFNELQNLAAQLQTLP